MKYFFMISNAFSFIIIIIIIKLELGWIELLFTHRSKQMHYFYYLKLKTIYNTSLWYTTICL
jgi:hypothetical protein